MTYQISSMNGTINNNLLMYVGVVNATLTYTSAFFRDDYGNKYVSKRGIIG
mgnify:FL=1